MYYRVSSQRVASETMDGEVVVLDQIVGTYYSLGGAGEVIWAMLERGASEEAILASVGARYEPPAGGDDALKQAVSALIAELRKDELIEVGEGEPPAVDTPDGAKRPWAEPRLERFTDLQSLLLLDPIHDVDEGGWPRQQQQP